MLTLDSALTVKLRGQHPQSKNQHGERKDNSKTKADAPDSLKMVLSSDRKNNKEDRSGQGSTKLTRIRAMADTGKRVTYGKKEVRRHDEN